MFKGFKDLSVEPRYKFWTNGEDNTITLGCFEARPEDEGDYKVEAAASCGAIRYVFLRSGFVIVLILPGGGQSGNRIILNGHISKLNYLKCL